MNSDSTYLMYLRKSRADNALETVEEVLARHEHILQEHAQKLIGTTIPENAIFREIVSGETIQDRPGMLALLQCIQTLSVKAVFVVEPQRLSRGDLQDCGTVIRAFQYTDTLIITPQKTYDLSEKFDRKFLEMELTRGNDYLEYVKEIMQRGRMASVREGNFIGSVAPYGYDKVKIGKVCTLIQNEESDVVRMIFDWYVYQNLGCSEICKRLDSLGIHPRKAMHWTPASIRGILENPVYIGKIRWNRRKTVRHCRNGEIIRSRPQTPEVQWILTEGKHPPLITEALFESAQKQQRHTPCTRRQAVLQNPFAGLCQCSCGHAIVLRKYRNAKARLVCQQQVHCHRKSVAYEVFEKEVLSCLEKCMFDSETEILYPAGEKVFSKTEHLQRELLAISHQQEQLYTFLERGVYSETVFRSRTVQLSQKRNSLEQALREEQAAMTEKHAARRTLRIAEALVCLKHPALTPQAKQDFLRCLIGNIVYENDAEQGLSLKITLLL